MQLGDKISVASVPIGLGSLAVGLGFPAFAPQLSPSVAASLVWGGFALIVFGLLVPIALHVPWRRLARRTIKTKDAQPSDAVGSALVGEERIALHEAAKIAYTETRHSNFARLSERLADGIPEEIERHYATTIYQSWPIYARRLPSTEHDLFPQTLLGHMRLLPKSMGIGFVGSNDVIYADPQVKRSDLAEFIRWAADTHEISPAGISTLGPPRL